MADEIKLKAPTVEQQVVVNINGEDKLKSFADTLDKISNNKNLQKYWKTQQDLINATADAYSNFQKKASKDNASELIKVTNALKAMSGTDLSHILPDFDKISKSITEAQKVAGNIDSAFSVKGFKEAFDSFETLKAYGTDIQKLFSHFGVSSDVGELQRNVRLLESEVEKLTRKLSNARNGNEELRKELDDFKVGSGFADKLDELDRLKAEMQNIRNEAIVTFNQFLEANKIDKYDWFNNDRFAEYFEKLENGTLTASEAIRQFKTEYDYLLEESFKSNGNSFGLDQLQAFSTKLDSIFQQVEETSNKINDILSNGVIAKSVQNLSEDTTLSDSQRSIFGNILQDEESLKSVTALFQKLIDETNQTKNTEVFNTEQFTKLESLFTSIESSLSSIKGVLVDVGDGEELSPLLKTIANIESAIDNLSSSVKGIGLNMNIDFGSDTEMEAKAQAKISNALQAYQNLFEHIKMSSAGGSLISQKFFDFDINQFDTPMSKLQAYIKFIKDMREEAKKMFGGQDILKIDTDDKYWNRASAAMGQVKKTFNEMKAASDTNPLENIFGKTDLTEVLNQLSAIVSKLDEISMSANRFADVFKDGLNVNASVEEIEKLTNRVKELEDELAKIKTPTTVATLQESNISSDISSQVKVSDSITDQIVANEKKKQEVYKATTETVMYHAGVISKLNKAETNGRFYGSDRGTGYFGTGHYFVDSNTKHELDNNSSYSSLPYTSIDISKYDNLFKATSDEVADALHTFLKNLTKFTQGSDSFEVSELFSQFQKVFGETTMDMQEFDAKLSQLKAYMQSSNMSDRGDSVSTQFMKSLGYGGVDTRGTKYADTRYGTVIYDLKEESVLQANITDELQKQGQMLEKINYEKGQVFDKSEDTRIQGILDQQAKTKEIETEFNKIFDSTNMNAYESELDSVNQKLTENESIINNCKSAIETADEDAKRFAKEMAEFDLHMSDEEIAETANKNKVEYQERIEELSKEQSLLKDRKQEIESNLDAEYKLANAARERATATVEDRMKDAFPNTDTKLDEAVTSAKDLDKTLKQVDIPTDSFDKVLEKLDRTKSELVDIVKITKQSVSDADGKFHDSYTLKDSRGSTEIYGVNSKTDKGQILRQNIVGYDVKKDTVDNSKELLAIEKQLQKEIETSDKANQKKFQDFQKEQANYEESVNKVNSAIQKTDEILDTLPLHDKLDGQFLDMIDSVDNLNSKLKSGEFTLSEYKNEVKSVTSEYSKMVSIQQKRDVEDYKANAKANLENAKNIKAEWDKNLKAIQDYMDAVTKLNNLKAKDKGTGSEANQIALQIQNVEELKQAAWDARKNLSSMQAENPDIIAWKQWVDMMELFDQASKGSAESAAKLKDALNNIKVPSLDKYENKLSSYLNKTGGYDATIARFNDGGWTSGAYLDNVQAVKDAVKKYKDLLNDIKAKGGIASEEDIRKLKEYEGKIKETISTVQNMSAAEKGYNFVSGQKELDKIHKLLAENSKMSSEAKAKIKAYYAEIESGNPSMSLDKIHGEILKIYNAEVEAGRAGRTLWDTLKNSGFHQIAAQMAGMIGVYDVINLGKEGFNVVRELNTALTEMRKVSDESIQTLKDYQKESFNTADAIATTGLQMQNSIADWQRLGYSIKEANELAKNSNIYKNVGDMDISTATEHMVSSVQAWKSEFNDDAVKTSEEVMNRYNKIGNEFAISSADIGEAMETSAAALKAGGNDLNEALGIITAGNIIQQDASTTSSAMKILSLRIRGAKADLESMGESTDDLADSTSKLREEIKGLTGVDIMADEDTFKSTAEIIKEIGAVWDQLSDVSQAATLEKLAGKNRASTVAGLIENYETIDKVIEAASNADNSALDENQKIIESIDGRIQQLSNRVQEFWYNLVDDSVVKSAVSAITTIVEGGTKLIDTFGTLPTLLTAIGAALSFKNVGTFKTIFSDINKVAVARDSLSGIRFDSKNVAVVEAYKNAIKGLNEEQARYVLSKRYVSEADQADLLTKAEIIAANDGVKASELSRQLVLQGVRKEQAEALIEQISGNEAITSNTVLTKEQTTAILEQAEARKFLSAQQRKNIADDIEETASSAQEASAEMAQASADIAESGTKMGSASSILARSVSQLGVGFKSLLSIFVSSPVAVIATLTGSVIGLTYVIGKFQDTAKNAAKAASEFSSSMSSANSTYNQESDSLNDLTEKYEDLREQLINAKGDEEKTYDIKSQLLELQEQLNDIYGDECDKVNLVTDAYKDQTAELKKNAKQKADNYLNTHVDEINEATKKMTTDYEYELGNFNYGLQDASVGNELHEQIKKLAEKSGIEWDDNKGFVFKGTAEEASKAIDQFMTDVRELRDSEDDLSDGIINNLKAFDSSMSDQLGVANEIIDGYQETYETAQMAQIASDKDLSQGYNEAVSAVEAYNDAVSKSDNPYDDENVKKAWDNLQTVKSGIQGNEDEWGQYSNIMDKVFSSASDDVYSFYQAIQNDDSIKSLTNDLDGLTDVDLQSMANDDTEDSFDKLCEAAKKYGLEVQDVIDLLIQLGIVQGKVQEQNSEETPISFEIPDAETLKQQISDLNSAIDSIQSAYDTLNSAIEEYNTNGGTLSIDTIQSLLSLSDEYLACLQVENGQLSLNADAMAQLAQSKLDDAQATAVTQAMTELQAIANGEAAQSTTNYITGNAALMSSLAQLSGSYEGVAKAAMTAAQAQRMSALISDAAGKDKTATENVMKGLDTKLKLIQTTKASISAGNFGKVAGKSSSSSKGSGSGKSASDTAKEEIEAYMEYLEKALEGGRITYNDYVRDVTLKLDDMYHKGRITAKEYFDYVEKRLNQQLEVYKSVLSAVTDLLEDEAQKWQDKIDALNDENDLLEKQKDDYDSILSAVDQVYQDEIDRLNEQKDLLQDKIDAINDENDALELQRKKQEALIALDKARQQRNVKIYTEDRGYFYDIDQDAYKDAQQNLQDIKNEEVIKKLEDEQDALDDSIELLEKYRDLWNDIADAYKKKTNEALAVALWGENYEKLILQNRTQDIKAFKDKYLEIQSKIDDNKSLIDSYQEKVDYYNKLKEQWNEISSAYEKEQQRMYTAQILGANWEKDVLDGRLDVLSQFRDQYLEIQRQMTQAALDGARARNDAVASEGSGSGGSSGGGGSAPSTPIQNQQAYHVLHLVGGYSTSGEASSKISSFNGKGVYKYKDGKWYVYKEEDYSNLSFGSKSEADDYIKKHLSPAGRFLVKYYHNGLENGLVDFNKKDSNFDLVQKYGLKKYEVPAILKQGEAVMNQEQIKNLGEALRAIPTAATLYTTPDYTKMLSSLKTNNTPVMVTQSVNITLPNVTNNSGYENLTRELNRLKLDAYQFANRRN